MRMAAVYYIAAIATAIAMVSASPDQLVVDTAFGKVRGVDEGTYSAFKGIPYEASTAGEGRWTAPKDPEPWEDVRDATKFGAICPQVPPENDVYVKTIAEELGLEGNDNSTYTMDEDCLFLNVYTPNVTGDLPVMVWIHGGTLVSGAGSQYPADGLVAEGVVVVTINYRLGFLGFFAHPDLDDTNFGLLDQVKALEWVQQNIASFGGDPDRVTIFGESAGGASVLALLVSPLAEGLFTNVIAQSPAIMESLNVTKEEAGDLGVAVGNFVNATGVPLYGISQIDQMRSAPAEDYVQAMNNFMASPWGPMAFIYKDIKSLPSSVYEAIQAGAQHDSVNLMIGTNQNETTSFLIGRNATSPITPSSYATLVSNAFGEVEITAPSTDSEAWAAYVELSTDLMFGSSAFGVAQGSARNGDGSTYLYMFDHQADPVLGAFHASEIPYAFNSTLQFSSGDLQDPALGSSMVTYWTNFAKNGEPDSTSLPNWPSFEEVSDSWQVLGSEISNEPIPESMREIYELAAPLYPPGILGSVGPIYGTNSTGWTLEDGVPAA